MEKSASNYVYNANGVDFKVYRIQKRSKTGLKDYWVLSDYSTGKRRLLNHQSKEEAEQRADQIRACTCCPNLPEPLLGETPHGHPLRPTVTVVRSLSTYESK